jgi:hypothetical protein
LQYSEQFDNVAWAKTNSTITANTTTAPNGTLTADTLSANGVLTAHYIGQPSPLVLGVTYTMSIYAKANTNRYVQVYSSATAFGANFFVNFDLQDGVVGTAGSAVLSSSIESIGDGWYRLTASAVALATSSTNNGLVIGLVTSLTSPRNESSTLSTNVFLWGAQLVEGTQPLPYQETVTRLALPRLDYRNADGTLSSTPRLLLEPQRTNSIRNSTMVGAVAGTPGTVPTNWFPSAGGLDRTIVGLGIENGLQYIDFRFYGVAITVDLMIPFDTTTGIPASNGQTWTNSFYFKSIDSTIAPVNYNLYVLQRTSGGSPAGGFMQSFVPTSTLSRYSQTVTTNSGFTAGIQPYFYALLAVGASYDFTIRIAAPQMELGSYATTFIPTTTAAVTRLADAMVRQITGLTTISSGTFFLDFERGLTSVTARDASTDGFFYRSETSFPSDDSIEIASEPNGSVRFARRVNSAFASMYTNNTLNRYKMLIKWNGTTAKAYVNGTQVFSGALVWSTPLVYVGYNSDFRKSVNQLSIFPTEISDTQAIELTTL